MHTKQQQPAKPRRATVYAAGATLVFLLIVLAACDSANGLIGVNTALVSDPLPAPSVSVDQGAGKVFVGDSVTLAASGSGDDVTYTWSVSGSGTIGSTGDTVSYTAPAGEGSETVTVTASAPGRRDSEPATVSLTVADNHFALLTNTSGVDLNQNAATALDMNAVSLDAAYFAAPSATELEVRQAGDYFLALTIPMQSTVQRASVRARVSVNGSPVPGALAESGYIRGMGGHTESSLHLAVLLHGLSAGDRVEVTTVRAAAAGTVTISDQATLYVEHVAASRDVFAAESNAAMDTADLYVSPASVVPIEWAQHVVGPGYAHSDLSDPERIELGSSGTYLVSVNVPLTVVGTDANDRVNIVLETQLDGVTVAGGQAKQGYIRRQDDHQNATLHWSGMVHASSGASVLRFVARRESAATITDQTVTMSSRKATVFVERIDTAAYAFAGRGTRTNSGAIHWNPASADSIAWEAVDVIDTDTYSHATALPGSDEITIKSGGDYLVVYNDSLAGASERENPRVDLRLDGSPVSGAQVKSHYMRNDSNAGNFESSGSLVFYLENVDAGRVLSVSTIAESDILDTVVADDAALLTVIRKR